MRASAAVIYDLSRTLDLAVLPNGSGILLRNDRPAFRLSDAEMRNLERTVIEKHALIRTDPTRTSV